MVRRIFINVLIGICWKIGHPIRHTKNEHTKQKCTTYQGATGNSALCSLLP